MPLYGAGPALNAVARKYTPTKAAKVVVSAGRGRRHLGGVSEGGEGDASIPPGQ